MIVQFILRLVFFYCIFVLVRSLFRSFINNQRKAPVSRPHKSNSNASRDPNVFDAEYTVIDKEKKS